MGGSFSALEGGERARRAQGWRTGVGNVPQGPKLTKEEQSGQKISARGRASRACPGGGWGRRLPSDARLMQRGGQEWGEAQGEPLGRWCRWAPVSCARQTGAGRTGGLRVSGEPAVRFRLKNLYKVPETRSYCLPQGKVPTHLAVSVPWSLAHRAAFWNPDQETVVRSRPGLLVMPF